MAEGWRLELLGDLRAFDDGCRLELSAGALRLLVAVVGVSNGGSGREDLRRLLWAVAPRTVNSSFRNLLSDVVQAGLVVASEARVWVERPVATDLDEFRVLARSADRKAAMGERSAAAEVLEQALALWRGPVPTSGGVGPEFVAWCDAVNAERRSAELRLARLLLEDADATGAQRALARLVGSGDRSSEVTRLAATAAWLCGDTASAVQLVRDALEQVARQGMVDPDLQRLELDLLNGTLPGDAGVHHLPVELRHALVPLIGRRAELRRLASLLGYAHVIVGHSGIGKSALVAAAVHELLVTTPAEIVVVQGRRREQERLGPWRVAMQRPVVDGNDVLEWLSTRPASVPLLIVVEDLHWCDAASVEVVRRLAQGLPSRRVGLLVTSWPGEHSDELRLVRTVVTIELGGLVGPELEDYCRSLLHREVTDIPTDQLDAADGNPLLLSLASADGHPGGPVAMGRTLLARLDPAERVAAVVALLFDDPIDIAWCNRVVAAAGLRDDSTATPLHGFGALSGAFAVGILVTREGRTVVRHDLIREALLASVEPSTIRLACRGVLDVDDAPAWVRAKAAARLGDELDRAELLSLLAEGVRAAETHRRFGDAAELLETTASLHDRFSDAGTVASLLLNAAQLGELAGVERCEQWRAEAFDLAERAGDRELMLSVVALPSALGRPIIDVASLQRSARSLSTFDITDERPALVMVRAERLALLPLLADYSPSDLRLIAWAQDFVRRAEPGLARRSVMRGLLCATIGDSDRRRWDALLDEILAEVHDDPWPDGGDLTAIDIRGDVLELAMRRCFERGDLRSYATLVDGLPAPVGPRRPGDAWARLMLAALDALLRGNLISARKLSRDAFDFGRRMAVPGHEVGWRVQQIVWRSLGFELETEQATEPDPLAQRPAQPAPTSNSRVVGAGLRALLEPGAADLIDELGDAFRSESLDVARLPAAALVIEWCWRLDRPAPPALVDVLVPLRGDHVILGFTSGWSLGPAWRLVTLARLLRGDISTERAERTLARLVERCERGGQTMWALLGARTIVEVLRRDGRDTAWWLAESQRLASMLIT